MNGGIINTITPEGNIVIEDIKMSCSGKTKFAMLLKIMFSSIHAAKQDQFCNFVCVFAVHKSGM
jgi:hypothetical protein